MGFFKKFAAYLGGGDKPAGKASPGRNDPCWCGSGRKYKKCHLHEDEKKQAARCPVNCGPT